jgi:hypothetical protein
LIRPGERIGADAALHREGRTALPATAPGAHRRRKEPVSRGVPGAKGEKGIDPVARPPNPTTRCGRVLTSTAPPAARSAPPAR